MPTRELKGETFLESLFLERAEAKEFCGVVVYRFWGSQPEIEAATKALTEVYPTDSKDTLGDAQWLGTMRTSVEGEARWVDLYELIVMREVGNGEDR